MKKFIPACVILMLIICSCGKYKVKHRGCECGAVNEHFEGGYLFMPNAFTPNGDGNNDCLFIRTKGATNINLKVKNSLGKVVYDHKNLEATLAQQRTYGMCEDEESKSNILHTNLYPYELSFTMPSGESKKISGKVTVFYLDNPKSKDFLSVNCIEHLNDCVFDNQWVADSLPFLPVDPYSLEWLNGDCN